MPSANIDLLLRVIDNASADFKKANQKTINEVKRLSQHTKKANQEHTKAVKEVVDGYRKLVLQIGAVIIAMRQVTRLISGMIDAASTVEQLNLRLRQTLGNVEEANQLFADMKELVATAPVEFEEVFQAVAALSAVTKKGADEVRELIPIILDISATFGLSIQDVTTNMIRVMSAGIASADQFRERGVSVALGFKAGVTKSAEESIEFIKKQWREGTNNIVGSVDNLRDAWKGRVGEMRDAWFFFKEELGKQIISSETVTAAQGGITGFLNRLTEGFRNLRENSGLTFIEAISNQSRTYFEVLKNIVNKTQERKEIQENLIFLFGEEQAALTEINMKVQEQAQSTQEAKEHFKDLKETIDETLENLKNIEKNLGEAIVKSVNEWSNAVGAGFASMIIDGENFGKSMERAFKQMAATFIAQVAAMTAKWLAFTALRAAGRFFGFFHEGGTIPTRHMGGTLRPIPKAHQGLAVDEVPIIAQTGEGILSRKGMQNLGVSNLNRLNAGQPMGGGGTSVNINIYNPNFRSRQDIMEMVNQIGFQLDKELRYAR